MIEISINQGGTIAEEIKANLGLLYNSREGTAALDRNFGLSQEWIDQPTELAKAALSSEIIEKTRKYEPRVEISDISFETSDGGLRVKVVIDIVED